MGTTSHGQAEIAFLQDDIVCNHWDSIERRWKDMAYCMESEEVWSKPDLLLTNMPLIYPPDIEFQARLQLLQASCIQVKKENKSFALNQLVFGHGANSVLHAIYIRKGDERIIWDDMLYHVVEVTFSGAKTFRCAGKTMTVLLIKHMTEWFSLYAALGLRGPHYNELFHYSEVDDERRRFVHKNIEIKEVSKDFFLHSLRQTLMNTEQFQYFIKSQSCRWHNCVIVSPEEAPEVHDKGSLAATRTFRQASMANAIFIQENPNFVAERERLLDEQHMAQMRRYGPDAGLQKYAAL